MEGPIWDLSPKSTERRVLGTHPIDLQDIPIDLAHLAIVTGMVFFLGLPGSQPQPCTRTRSPLCTFAPKPQAASGHPSPWAVTFRGFRLRPGPIGRWVDIQPEPNPGPRARSRVGETPCLERRNTPRSGGAIKPTFVRRSRPVRDEVSPRR